jgi:uncharacterized protein
MLPLTRQIQIASDGAKGCVARLAGQEVPKWDDNEASSTTARAHPQDASTTCSRCPRRRSTAARAREIVLPMRRASRCASAARLPAHFVLPNFYFHATTTYALLRHAGVELGKRDYLGDRAHAAGHRQHDAGDVAGAHGEARNT